MDALRRLVARAIRALTPSVEEVAEKLELSSSALRRYRGGSRGVPPSVARKLALLMRQRAKELERLAARLEEEAIRRERRKR